MIDSGEDPRSASQPPHVYWFVMTSDVCGRCGGDDWYVTPSNGWRRCRACHAGRNERYRTETKLQTLPDKIAALQSELDSLRQQYSSDPTNWRLGTEVGRAEQTYRYWVDHDKRESEMAAQRQHDAEASARRRAYRPPDSREFDALIPKLCPSCGEATRLGYVQRVGETGWYHRTPDCEKTVQRIEWSPNG